METAITHDIRVSVEAMYQSMYSKPLAKEYIHAYRITIENLGEETVQLMRRQWLIWDSTGVVRKVEGDGVVGLQPTLEPDGLHQYVSGCPLKTDIGKMSGRYTMQRLSDGVLFDVEIPTFYLIPPFKLN
ncbi:Co2+/Mg2+ efflux protein ApaG [Aureispira anguillae]|uniref:Co2+/Mg2+ efflux protein ApaG n=1 Tax=Aureispira anguillae TaxID=2864201 RepID=A0A915YGA7_9BACT|nr:Co2+/Mg2+ efflux protein ApaG [Aureispira anguillae]BDS12613.1 Co2+/Mg2+ efflux protein ApaG [Aureispira anguillae]